MTGYCSNSPLRCVNARSMIRLERTDGNCPNCKMALVTNYSLSTASKAEQRILQASLCVTVLLLAILVYLYYANFT